MSCWSLIYHELEAAFIKCYKYNYVFRQIRSIRNDILRFDSWYFLNTGYHLTKKFHMIKGVDNGLCVPSFWSASLCNVTMQKWTSHTHTRDYELKSVQKRISTTFGKRLLSINPCEKNCQCSWFHNMHKILHMIFGFGACFENMLLDSLQRSLMPWYKSITNCSQIVTATVAAAAS